MHNKYIAGNQGKSAVNQFIKKQKMFVKNARSEGLSVSVRKKQERGVKAGCGKTSSSKDSKGPVSSETSLTN